MPLKTIDNRCFQKFKCDQKYLSSEFREGRRAIVVIPQNVDAVDTWNVYSESSCHFTIFKSMHWYDTTTNS